MDDDWERLGRTVRAERARRWPRRNDFATATGISIRVLVDLEGGHRSNYQPETIAAVEAALGWEPGSAERIRHGLAPRRREDPMLTRIRVLWPRLSADAKVMVVELIERAAAG